MFIKMILIIKIFILTSISFGYASSYLLGVNSNIYHTTNDRPSFDYTYQQIFKNFHYNNFSFEYLFDGRDEFLTPFSLKYDRGFFINSIHKKFPNLKGFVDCGLKISSNHSHYLIFAGSKLGFIARINSAVSQFMYLQYYISSDYSYNHVQLSYGIHYFRGEGLNNEFKTDRLKRKKRAILKFL